MKFLVLGLSGQDGQILEVLAEKHSIEIFGISHKKTKAKNKSFFWDGSSSTLREILLKTMPDVVVNFSAVHSSSLKSDDINFNDMYKTNAFNVLTILQQIYYVCPSAKYVNSLSSHMYKENQNKLIDENTFIEPRNFYGLTKKQALDISEFFENNYGIKTLNLIMFNHESEFRSEDFLTKRISKSLAEIYKGKSAEITVENQLKAEDFSDAYDFMEALIYLCKHEKTGRFVLSSNKLSTIQDLIYITGKKLGINNIKIISNNPQKSYSLTGDNKKLLSTGFKFNSNIIEALHRMTIEIIENE